MKKILLEYSDISIFVIVVTLIDFLFRKRMGFDIGMNLALGFHFLYLAFFCGLFLLTGKKLELF